MEDTSPTSPSGSDKPRPIPTRFYLFVAVLVTMIIAAIALFGGGKPNLYRFTDSASKTTISYTLSNSWKRDPIPRHPDRTQLLSFKYLGVARFNPASPDAFQKWLEKYSPNNPRYSSDSKTHIDLWIVQGDMGWVTLTDGYPLPVAPPGLTDGKEYRIQDQKKMLVSGQKASLTTISFTAAKPSPRCTLLVKLTNKPIYITAYGDCYDPRDYPKVRAELESIVSSIKVETASPPNPQ